MNTARHIKAIPVLSLIKDGSEIKSISLDQELSLGRSEQCNVQLEGQSVSRKHARVRVDAQGVTIEKQSEFAPLSVNGLECTRAILKEGDIVQIGPYLLKLKSLEQEVESRTKIIQSVRKEVLKTDEVLETSPPPEEGKLLESVLEEAAVQEVSEFNLNPPADSPVEPSLNSDSSFENNELKLDPPEGSSMSEPSVSPDENSPTDDFNNNGNSEEVSQSESQSDDLHEPNDLNNLSNSTFEQNETIEKTDDIQVGENDPTRVTDLAVGRLVLISGEADFTEYEIQKQEVVIGRGKDADIVLNDKKCSRKHATIESRAGRFYFKDLDSANGSFVNDERTDQAELYHEDVIRIGRVEMRFFAKQKNYEEQQGGFLEVQQEEMQQGLIDSSQQNGMLSMPESAGGLEGISGIETANSTTVEGPQGNSLLAKFRALPPRKQIIYGIGGLLALYMLLEEEPDPVKKQPDQKTQTVVKTHPSVRPSVIASVGPEKSPFEKLPLEQQQYIENQHQLAFRHFTNKEYDKAIYEIRKIFELIPEYKNAREIERYALDGQRILRAAEEERRKKEEELEFRQKLAEMIAFTSTLMKQKDYEAAKEKFGEILALEPDNEQVDEWKQEIEEYEERIRLEEQDKQVQKELNQRAWGAYQEALAIKKRGNCHSAIVEFGKVSDIGATDRKPAQLAAQMAKSCREEINNKRDPLLAEAKQLEDSGELSRAFQTYKKATQVDPPHRAGYAGMDRIRNVLHQKAKIIYTEAVLAESYSDFSVAKRKYEEVLMVAPEDDLYFQRAKRKLGRFISTSQGEQ